MLITCFWTLLAREYFHVELCGKLARENRNNREHLLFPKVATVSTCFNNNFKRIVLAIPIMRAVIKSCCLSWYIVGPLYHSELELITRLWFICFATYVQLLMCIIFYRIAWLIVFSWLMAGFNLKSNIC